MAQTTDAVKSRLDDTREKISETAEDIRQKITSTAHSVTDNVSNAVSQPSSILGKIADNPLGMAFGAMAVGFIAGTIAPHTKVEDRAIGSVADDFKNEAEEIGSEIIQTARKEASEVLGQGSQSETEPKSQSESQPKTSSESKGQGAQKAGPASVERL
jgi:gas vesicle protein